MTEHDPRATGCSLAFQRRAPCPTARRLATRAPCRGAAPGNSVVIERSWRSDELVVGDGRCCAWTQGAADKRSLDAGSSGQAAPATGDRRTAAAGPGEIHGSRSGEESRWEQYTGADNVSVFFLISSARPSSNGIL
jgi:hypothetical protein